MCYLVNFLCCIPLFAGCIFISVTGLIMALWAVLYAWLTKVHFESQLFQLIAIFIYILYVGGKLFLLIGTLAKNSGLLLMSFIIGLNAMIYFSFGACYWICPHYKLTFPYVLGTHIFVLEFYFLWVVLSYWTRYRNKMIYGSY